MQIAGNIRDTAENANFHLYIFTKYYYERRNDSLITRFSQFYIIYIILLNSNF